jgi:hypothetical protein
VKAISPFRDDEAARDITRDARCRCFTAAILPPPPPMIAAAAATECEAEALISAMPMPLPRLAPLTPPRLH